MTLLQQTFSVWEHSITSSLIEECHCGFRWRCECLRKLTAIWCHTLFQVNHFSNTRSVPTLKFQLPLYCYY